MAEAAALARRIQVELAPLSISKLDRSPVTVADFAAQALVGRLFESRWPAECLVAEEDSTLLRSPQGSRVLDSITRFLNKSSPEASPDQVCASTANNPPPASKPTSSGA